MSAALRGPRRSARGLRVLLLTHADLIPPLRARRFDPGRPAPPWATEQAVEAGLRRLGHEVRVVGLDDELLPLDRSLDAFRPDVVFNLLEEFDDSTRSAAHVVAYLEALGYPVTGCSAEGLVLAGDKTLARRLLAADGVPVAPGFVVPRGRPPRQPRGMPFPLVVKSATEHASASLTQASIVGTPAALAARARSLHRALGTDALVESYVEGRELYVTVLAGPRPRALPPWELHRRGVRRRRCWLASERLKAEPAFRRRLGYAYARAAPLAPRVAHEVARVSCAASTALRMTGCARVDLRLPPDGRPVVLEVNPNPDLLPNGEVARSARAAGLSYGALLGALLSAARRRAARG